MAFLAFFGAIMIAGIVGYVSEKSGFTHNGFVQSIIIAVGGAVLFFMVRVMFGISFGPPGVDAIISAVGALVLVPTHYRK